MTNSTKPAPTWDISDNRNYEFIGQNLTLEELLRAIREILESCNEEDNIEDSPKISISRWNQKEQDWLESVIENSRNGKYHYGNSPNHSSK